MLPSNLIVALRTCPSSCETSCCLLSEPVPTATECRETFACAFARPTPVDFAASTNDDGASSVTSSTCQCKQAVKFIGVFSQEVGSHTSTDVALAVHHDSHCVQIPDVVREGERMWMALWGFSVKERREVILDAWLVIGTAFAKLAGA